jgi:hypothetical protein
MPTKYDGKKSGLPDKPEIPNAYLAVTDFTEDYVYEGPIEPGMIFAWEPCLPYARELIIVATVIVDKVGSYSFPKHDYKHRSMHLNDMKRFREAVLPTIYKKFPTPGSAAETSFTPLPRSLRDMLDEYAEKRDKAEAAKDTKAETPDQPHPARYMNLTHLEHEVSQVWTDAQYPYEFNYGPAPHRHFTHALIHVIKACGKLTEYIDAADHGGGPLYFHEIVPKALADIIISTQRMATVYGLTLVEAVNDRLNTLRERYQPKSLDDNIRYENSARIMFEQIHPDVSWERLTPEAKHSWRNIAKNHFIMTTHANVSESWSKDQAAEFKERWESVRHPSAPVVMIDGSPAQDQETVRLVPRRITDTEK